MILREVLGLPGNLMSVSCSNAAPRAPHDADAESSSASVPTIAAATQAVLIQKCANPVIGRIQVEGYNVHCCAIIRIQLRYSPTVALARRSASVRVMCCCGC